MKLRRIEGGSSGGYAGGASSGYSTPQGQQVQTLTLRQVEPEFAGVSSSSGGFSAPYVWFTLSKLNLF